jgi:UDP-N-acetylglucosamine acyltransferase
MCVIHPTAIIHPKAELHPTVKVGPYAVIDEGVKVGAHCVIGPHVYLTGNTEIGEHNRFFASCVIGEAPQDLKYKGAATTLHIQDRNVFREHVTVNRATDIGEDTVVGSNNLLMATVHVAHNCCLGNNLIIANGAMLGGHVIVGDRAVISGSCLVHQFVRVGTFSMMQGGSAISKDLPPYTVARGNNGICGLNTVGLRRAGFTPAQRLELKQLYRALFREGVPLKAAVGDARERFTSPTCRVMLDFLEKSRRGTCADHGRRSDDEGEEEE